MKDDSIFNSNYDSSNNDSLLGGIVESPIFFDSNDEKKENNFEKNKAKIGKKKLRLANNNSVNSPLSNQQTIIKIPNIPEPISIGKVLFPVLCLYYVCCTVSILLFGLCCCWISFCFFLFFFATTIDV